VRVLASSLETVVELSLRQEEIRLPEAAVVPIWGWSQRPPFSIDQSRRSFAVIQHGHIMARIEDVEEMVLRLAVGKGRSRPGGRPVYATAGEVIVVNVVLTMHRGRMYCGLLCTNSAPYAPMRIWLETGAWHEEDGPHLDSQRRGPDREFARIAKRHETHGSAP